MTDPTLCSVCAEPFTPREWEASHRECGGARHHRQCCPEWSEVGA